MKDWWFEEVIIPALNKVSRDSTSAPYLDFSYRHMRTRDGHRPHGKEYTFDKKHLQEFISELRRKVAIWDTTFENYNPLRIFGSFFFVGEAKGIKLPSMTDSFGDRPIHKFLHAIPQLDWEMLCEPTKAACYVDVGVVIQPKQSRSDGSDPLVGLWSLYPLITSYKRAGFTPTTHTSAQFARFGGIEGQPSQERANRTQIIRQIHYCLAFEVVHIQAGKIKYYKDQDALLGNAAYKKVIDDYLFTLDQSKSK